MDTLWRNAIDYAQIVKEYGSDPDADAPILSRLLYGVRSTGIMRAPPTAGLISTSYVERQNLTMRMGMRRFTRLTNGFSKKVENHAHAMSLFYAHYNFCRVHQTLTRKAGRPATPAMAAGVASHPWSLTQLAELLESN